jgi:hypothetical protein
VVLNFQIPPLEPSPSAQSCISVSWEQNGYYAAQDFLLHGCALDERSSSGIWKFRTSFFKCHVDHSYTMYSSGNIDVRNWVHLFETSCIIIFSPHRILSLIPVSFRLPISDYILFGTSRIPLRATRLPISKHENYELYQGVIFALIVVLLFSFVISPTPLIYIIPRE